MKTKTLSSLAAGLALSAAAFGCGAAQAGVVYQSIPDLSVNPNINGWCTDCYGGGVYEPLDEFSLSKSAHITSFEFVADANYGNNGLGAFTLEVFNSGHTEIVFSQAITPSLVSGTPYETNIVSGNVSGLSLGAGTYWVGFIAPYMAASGFDDGGNGSLIDTTPHTGHEILALGGDIGYQFSSAAPEPSTWAMMLIGFAGLGFVGYRQARRKDGLAVSAG
jgi:hypothetical protein